MIALLFTAMVQCPDGSPPPCARPAAPAAAAAPDPRRIAVLPFRVTTADSLLGEGLAELIATEFTGEAGPRSVNMGTVLRAWRVAGGGLRSPLSQTQAIRLARDMGAGMYVEGSVVGLGQRLTINAAVVTVPGGTARRATPVSGPADSLDVLVSRVTTGLLASAGSDAQANRTRLTDSPAAMRAYLEGLSHWRASQIHPAADAFDRAIREDTLFARAMFMRWSVGTWSTAVANLDRRVMELRDRLSPADRLLVEARFGTGPRPPARLLADLRDAAQRLPESAEAQYFYGDWLYHHGRTLDIGDHMEQARVAFERSIALDSQSTVLQHLMEIALFAADSALVRRVLPAYDRAVGGAWDWGMATAAMLGDRSMYASQRRRAGPIVQRPPVGYIFGDLVMPAEMADEVLELARANYQGALLPTSSSYIVAIIHGRPAAARRAASAMVATTRDNHDLNVARAALVAEADREAGFAAMQRLRRDLPDSAGAVRYACLVAHWEFVFPAGLTWDGELLRRRAPRCAAATEAAMAVRERRADALATLLAADSVVRAAPTGDPGVDQYLMARTWEAFGDLPRALAMIKVRLYGFGNVTGEATRLRHEGRLAALTGDTTGAIRAYRRYLGLRQDAEPPLIPQRDSVRAELTRLQAR